MRNKIIFIIIVFILSFLFIAIGRSYWRIPANLTGKIIMPMKLEHMKTNGIYYLDLEDGKTEKIFFDENYDEVYFPNLYKDSIIFSAHNIHDDYYSIIIQKDNLIKEHLKLKNPIYFPTFVDERFIILYIENNHNYYLYKLDTSNDNLERIYDRTINEESRPIVSQNSQILFTAKEDVINTITLLDRNGQVTRITQGTYPFWYKEQQEIIYNHSHNLYSYNLSSGEKKILKKYVHLTGTPTLSPDKKFIVFCELDDIPPTAATMDFLSIINLENKSKTWIQKYLKKKGFSADIYNGYYNYGYVWIK